MLSIAGGVALALLTLIGLGMAMRRRKLWRFERLEQEVSDRERNQKAWMAARIVSPRPLSVFVPVVTLIAFPIPASITCVVEDVFHYAERACPLRQKMVLILILSKLRRKP